MKVAGVDGWKGRWVAVFLENGAVSGIRLFDSIRSISELNQPEVIGIDVPIGLQKNGSRKADLEARKLVGSRSSSIFSPPNSFCLNPKWKTHAEANAESKRLTGSGISVQAFGLMNYIREADAVAKADSRIYEVHPEVCFAHLNSRPLDYSKKTWNGQQERIRLLETVGITLPSILEGELGKVPPDDLLDAAAVAWSAHRIAHGKGKALPDAEARMHRIWY